MKVLRILLFVVGAAIAALGALWLLQGLGVVHLKPVACVAHCEELKGRSWTWAGIGGATLVVGLAMLSAALRRTRPARA